MSKTKKIISVVLAAMMVMAIATVAIVTSSALEDGEMHVVAGAPELCGNGTTGYGWDPADTNNQMTFNADKGIYEKVYENVAVGTYEFKVTTGGAWDNGDFNLDGDARFGGANAVADVTVDGSTVIVGFDGTKALLEIVAPEVDPTDAPTEAPVVTDAPTEAPVVTEPATDAPVVTEPTEAPVVTEPATEDEPATDDEPVVTEPTEAPVVTEPATDAPVVTEPATDAPVVTEPATDAPVVTEPAAKNVIVMDGVEYEVKVGDVITYTSTLTTPDFIENIHGSTTFDASKLTLIDATAAERFPNINGVVTNVKDGVVYFNASEIATGYDFVGGKVLVTLQFEVTDASYSEITTVIEEMCKLGGDDFITGSEIVADGVAVAETLTVKTEEPTTPDTQPTTGAPIVTEPTTAEKTDATSTTDKPAEKPDAPITGASATIYVVLAVLALAAAAVVVLRKKVNG